MRRGEMTGTDDDGAATEPELLLDARGVTVSVDGHDLVRDADLRVEPGELVAVIGPNGAGKSTLVGVLAGDRRPTAGTVTLRGRPLSSWSPTALAQQRAVLPQRSTVSFPFTVGEVVAMGRTPWARSARSADDDEAVRTALQATEVTHLRDRRLPTLSGGEQARVALARVLAQRTPLLLLDEPTAALDLRHQESVISAVRARLEDGAGAVVVAHDLSLAAAHADRVVAMTAGRVVADGPPTAVLREGLLHTVYDHPLDVVAHPHTGALLVAPRRGVRQDRPAES